MRYAAGASIVPKIDSVSWRMTFASGSGEMTKARTVETGGTVTDASAAGAAPVILPSSRTSDSPTG
eukprot:2811795-Pleurochrysis_carterae.AAC.1